MKKKYILVKCNDHNYRHEDDYGYAPTAEITLDNKYIIELEEQEAKEIKGWIMKRCSFGYYADKTKAPHQFQGWDLLEISEVPEEDIALVKKEMKGFAAKKAEEKKKKAEAAKKRKATLAKKKKEQELKQLEELKKKYEEEQG